MTAIFTAHIDLPGAGDRPSPDQHEVLVYRQALRHALGRRRAGRLIARLVASAPSNVVAFPLSRVGFVQEATRRPSGRGMVVSLVLGAAAVRRVRA